jgi:transposase, IS30 family
MSQLTIVERSTINALRREGKTFRYISRRLSRAASTVTREFKRNMRPRHGYDPVDAQERCDKRRRQNRRLYKFKDQRIRDYVETALREKFSPNQVSGRIQKDIKLYVSHESIYRFVYRDKEEGDTLWKNLRRKHKQRRPRIKLIRKPKIKNRIGIELRPKIVELKRRFGDLEIDTVIGKNHIGAILTIVDRKTKFLWAKFIKRNTAEEVRKATQKLLKEVKGKVKTITSDNGSEFTCHQKITKSLKVDFYFADPYSSWQRGLNEHTNGLLRQYYPKKTAFNKTTLRDLQEVVNQINNRPRKVLKYKTPKEEITRLLKLA